MATMEASLYSVGMAIFFALLCVLRFLDIEHIISNPTRLALRWFEYPQKKPGLHNTSITTADRDLTSKYSPHWWTDQEQFRLERRAFFSKSWLFVTHVSRFQKPGDYRTFEIAGFSFIVILGKDNQLRSFHNVCRHRAYAITKKESGSSTVLGCRYHGWSYDTKGKLVKAPEFENVVGFDKALNDLWELKTEVLEGIVAVNFEVGNNVEKLGFGKVQSIMRDWKIDGMKWTHEWKVAGAFNWKLTENLFADDDLGEDSWKAALLGIFRCRNNRIILSHNAVLRRLPSGRILTLRALPISAHNTMIECNLYGKLSRHTKNTQLELEAIKREIDSEIKGIEVEQESFREGKSHYSSPNQDKLNEILRQHKIAEVAAGKEFHPAARTQSFTEEGTTDNDLCKELESTGHKAVCSAKTGGFLDW